MPKKRMWRLSPAAPKKTHIPESVKQELDVKVNELIETVLKPKHIAPPPSRGKYSYLTDIYSKWYRHYLYLCATYNNPGQDAMSLPFEVRFGRLEYTSSGHFNIAYMRHTGKWHEIRLEKTLPEVLEMIGNDSLLTP